ncbi:(R)-specific enoyl-CoA hydratase [bacterium MnTg02]|nr:(R)-specific enoyl-CoA hydratase [bacterium MnTg02]
MNKHERFGYYFEELEVGMEASYVKIITAEDIDAFAVLSGDDNPIHLDEDFASRSIFKKRIAHGILTASFISTVLGTRLPGPGCIYVSQSLNFRAPVHIGDEVVAQVRVQDLIQKRRRAVICCDCSVNGGTVLDGEAVLMVPSRP